MFFNMQIYTFLSTPTNEYSKTHHKKGFWNIFRAILDYIIW